MAINSGGASTSREELVSKPGTKSEVWQYFGLAKGPDGKAVCQ